MKPGNDEIFSLIQIILITIKSDSFMKILDSRSRLHGNYSNFKKFKCRRAGMTNLCF